MTVQDLLLRANRQKAAVAALSEDEKNTVLAAMADAIEKEAAAILEANALDMDAAKDRISPVMLDRLALNNARIKSMADGIRALIPLSDPTGRVLETITRPNGIVVEKTAVPLGVVAIIYESRPNVTADAAALCLKSGNTCILRTGKDAFRSANAIVKAMQAGLAACDLSPDAVQLLEDISHEGANQLMRAKGQVDLLIPRGGKRLIQTCVENSIVPCIETGTGICHIYVDSAANQEMALNIIENAKTSRPSVCNAEEVLLVAKDIAAEFLPKLKTRLTQRSQPVELRLDKTAQTIIEGTPAGEDDFDTEFLDYILAVAVVDNVDAAIEHIAIHSTHHSDAIITADAAAAKKFTLGVDSAAVYVNASTRFTDGGEFGLGCEMGISTQKLHARGPIGLAELTTYKYIIRGNGQIR